MVRFCKSDSTDDLDTWQCAVFVTFVLTQFLLLVLAIWLYTYYRWQENLKRKLYEEDYEHNRFSSIGQRSRKSSQNTNRNPLHRANTGSAIADHLL